MMPMRKFLKFVLLAGLLLLLAACGAEDGDLTPPDVAFDGGGAGFSPTQSTSAHLTGTKSADATIDIDINTAASVSNLVQDASIWSCDITGLVEGSNTIYVTATDPVGNNRQLQITIVVDLTGPKVTLDQYQGTVGELGSTVEISTDGGLSWSPVDGVDANLWWYTFTGADGTSYDVQVRGTDRVGNVTAVADYAVLPALSVDSLAPAFSIDQAVPYVLPAPLTDSTASLSGLRPSGATLTVANTPASSYVLDTSSATVWTLNYSILAGGNTVATFAVDDAGNVAQAKVLLWRDLDAPQVLDVPRSLSPGSASIDVDFGEEMSATIDIANLTLLDETGTAVTLASAELLAGTRTYRFTTSLGLVAGTYTATLQTTDTAPLLDARNNALAAPYIWKIRVN